MANNPPQNLRRGVGRISGEVVNRLNKLDDGVGTLLLREINQKLAVLSGRIEAQAGHKGSVHIAPQGREVSGKPKPAIVLGGQRASGMDDPIDDEDGVNLRYFRRFRNCEWFEKMFDECIEDEPARAGGGAIPYFFGYMIHPPNASDTVVADPDTNLLAFLWPTLLTESASVSEVVYNLEAYSALSSVPFINIGLYDSDYTLLCETGPINISAGGSTQKVGVFVNPLNTEVSLSPGLYYFAFASGTCMRMYCWAVNSPVVEILNCANSSVLDFTTLSSERVAFITEETDPPLYEGFPASLTHDDIQEQSFFSGERDVPIVLFQEATTLV